MNSDQKECEIDSKVESKDESKSDKTDIEKLLLDNEELLAEVLMEGKYRKYKNMLTPRMSFLINHLERNIIKIAKEVSPEALSDPEHVLKEKERFLRFYQKRNNPKKSSHLSSKWLSTNKLANKIVFFEQFVVFSS